MLVEKRLKKIFYFSSLFLLASFFVFSNANAAGLTVGNNAQVLDMPHENLYYGVTSAANDKGNFLLFEKGYGNTVFKIDYNGNITTNGSLLGSNSYWNINGSDLFASSTAWNIGIGTTTTSGFKLNVVGDARVSGTLTAGAFNGTYNGTIAAPNVSSGAFAANTGGGNFTFPGSVGIGTTNTTQKLVVSGAVVATGGLMSAAAGYTSPYNLFSLSGDYPATSYGITYVEGAPDEIRIQGGGVTNHRFGMDVGNAYLAINSGSVGIGTTAPKSKLDIVAGGIQAASGVMNTGVIISNGYGQSALNLGNYANQYSWIQSAYTDNAGVSQPLSLNPNGGNVGIGTTNPGTKLDVAGVTPVIRLTDTRIINWTGGEVLGSLQGYTSDTNDNGAHVAAGIDFISDYPGTITSPTVGIRFLTSSYPTDNFVATEKLRITSTGNVGIGTTNPYALLDVRSNNILHLGLGGQMSGVPALQADASDALALYGINDNGNTDYRFYVEDDSTDSISFWGNSCGHAGCFNVSSDGVIMKLRADGNVGIGTTDPGTYKLNVNGNTNITGALTAGAINGPYNGTIAAPNVSAGEFGTNTGGGNYIFGATTSGNVGIGTASPTLGKLQINTVAGSTWLYLQNTSETGFYTRFLNNGTTNGSASPFTKLSMGHSGYGDNASVNFYRGGDVTGGFLTFTTNTDAERMRIDTSGNVGIGTTAPGTRLDVGSTTADYIRSYGGFTGNAAANIGGTGAAAYFPNGAYINGANSWIYGGVSFNGILKDNQGTARWQINPAGNSWFNGGNVGIGTTGPDETLHIKTNETGVGASLLQLDNSGTASNEVGMNFYTSASDGGRYPTGRIYGKWDGTSYATSRLTLQSSTAGGFVDTLSIKNGNVGIATTDPGAYKLNVNGNTNITGALTAGAINGPYNGTIGAPNVSAGTFAANTGGGNFNFPGRVNIGTTTPVSHVLYVNGTTYFNGDSTVNGISTVNSGLELSTSGTRSISYYGSLANNYFTRMETTATSGFGTYGPVTSDWALYNRFDGSNTRGWIWQFGTTNIAALNLQGHMQIAGNFNSQGTGNNYFAGNVGIGTSIPGAKLQVLGNSKFGSANSQGLWVDSTAHPDWGTQMYLTQDLGSVQGAIKIATDYTLGGGDISPNFVISRSTNTQGYSLNPNSLSYSPVLVINRMGNVGIGTTDPGAYKLNVNGNTNITGALTAGAINGPYNGTIGAPNVSSGTFAANTGGGNFSFSGSVGIGTTTPASRLDVADSFRVFNSGAPSYYSYLKSNWADADAFELGVSGHKLVTSGNYYFGTILKLWTSDAERMRIDASGNVGIGTTNPGSKLELLGVSDQLTGNLTDAGSRLSNLALNTSDGNYGAGAAITFGNSQSTAAGSLGMAAIKAVLFNGAGNTTGGLTFSTRNSTTDTNLTEKMRIDNVGNVGIGTDNPTTKLQVAGGAFSLYNSASWDNLTLSTDGSSSYIQGNGDETGIRIRSAAGNVLLADDRGNVGIGTSNPSTAKLAILGGEGTYAAPNFGSANLGAINILNTTSDRRNGITFSSAGGNNAQAGIYVHQDNSAGTHMYLATTDSYATGPQARLTILNNGNVGIGTTAPGTNKLKVVGNVDATSFSGALSGTVSAANVSSGTFGSNTGGGNYSFSGNLDVAGTGFYTGKLNLGASEGLGVYGIRGRNTNEQIEMYNRVSIGSPNGWTVFPQAPNYGLSTYGGANFATNQGNVGIGTTAPGVKLDISGASRVTTGSLNTDDYLEKVFNNAINFPNGVANQAVDIRLGASKGFWGYIEVEVNSTYANQNSVGKLTKVFAVGLQSDGTLYTNESRVSDAMGTIPDNIAIGDISWDAANSTWKIPISHIVSTGNNFSVRVRFFGNAGGGKNVFDSINLSNVYTLTALPRQYVNYNGNVGIGTTDPGTYKLNVNGATNVSGAMNMAGGASVTGNLSVSGQVTANKLNVNTIDPLYNIKGINYASFAASIVGGVKEEVMGKLKINTKKGNEYQAIINFDKEPQGTDLWVWRKVIDFGKDNVEVNITPYGSFANTYYYISGNSIVFKADRPTEISYRLTAKRFDWKNWPTIPVDQTEKAGMIIK